MIDVLLLHALTAQIVFMVTIVLFDALVGYLQGEDPWRIPLSTRQTVEHLFVLYLACGLGYWFGWMIGSALPFSQPHEPFVIGCAFSAMATMIARGQHMMYFHRLRREEKND